MKKRRRRRIEGEPVGVGVVARRTTRQMFRTVSNDWSLSGVRSRPLAVDDPTVRNRVLVRLPGYRMRSQANGNRSVTVRFYSSTDRRRWPPSRRIIGCRREVAEMTGEKKKFIEERRA